MVDYHARTVTLDEGTFRIDRDPDDRFAIVDVAHGREVGWAIVGLDGAVTWSSSIVGRVVMAWVTHCLANGLDPWPPPAG